MNEPVKRQYRSALRVAQARETRRLIVSEAARQFVEKGYGATTIDAVAEEAGVSRKTVFTSVGGKADLLELAMNWSIAGDDDPVPLADRPPVQGLLGLTDPARLLREWSALFVDIDARVAALARALDVAADTDAQAHALRRQLARQRLADARRIVNRLAELKSLRPGLLVDAAVDIAWLYSDPMLYHRLVHERGWTTEQFAQWVSATLVTELLVD